MTKNAKAVLIAVILAVAILLVIAVFVVRDLRLRSSKTVTCPDGTTHPTIDMRDFTTQYWAYSAKLEASVEDKGKISAEVDPQVISQVSEGLQQAKAFRQYVVAGYNSCAITPAQYAQLGSQFYALDSVAQQIEALLSKASLTQAEKTSLADFVNQYRDLVKKLKLQ